MVAKQPSASDKTLIVLDAVMEHSRFADIVNATGLAKSSVHRILQSLTDYGFVSQGEGGYYVPGPRVLSFAARAFEKLDVSSVATPIIRSLSASVGEQVHLGAHNGKEAIYIAVQRAQKPFYMPSQVGGILRLHSTSIGKIFLASADDELFESYIVEPGLTQFTPRTITDPAQLAAELEQIKTNGWAIDDEENVPGIRCLAAPVHNHLGIVTHALSISTLALEHDRATVESFAPTVISAANELSALLGYHG